MSVIVSKGNSPYRVSSGTADTGDAVVSGGSMYVLSGGTAEVTTVSSGGLLTIRAGGTANSTTVSSGGFEIVSSGAFAFRRNRQQRRHDRVHRGHFRSVHPAHRRHY